MKKKSINFRVIVLTLLLIAVFLVYTGRLAKMQLVDADVWKGKANPESTRTGVIKAARGEILDRYGRPLAVNREGYNIIFDGAYLPAKSVNTTIKTLVTLLSKTKEAWRDELPMEASGSYGFAKDKKDDITSLKKKLGINSYATAQNCFDAMVERYKLENFSKSVQRTIMGIRYTMEKDDFSIASSYTFAEDISMDTTLKIKESTYALTGVDVEVVPIREYVDPSIAPHVLGTIGPIYAEDWQELKQKGYQYNDKVGKSGIEYAMESYLRGTDGKKTVHQDSNGNVTSVEITQEPVSGNTVILTVDKELQRVAQKSLETLIKRFRATVSPTTKAGAVVIMNVNNGEILASANYPSYSLDEYQKNYSKLANDSSQPLFDRALNGTYEPGSTFKPATALAGLQTGKITKSTIIRCVHEYSYYKDQSFYCMGWHYDVNVVRALSVSCNYFFYDLGRRIGINTLNQYCRLFGLGVSTGVEIPESTGILAGPEYRALQKSTWNPGDTLQAAIGQSDNAFTPLQLAVYASTIANGGTRYQAHYAKEVKSYGLDETVKEFGGTVVNKTGIAKSAYNTVKQGMLSVTEDGTARQIFANYKIQVGGKTGTSQNPTGVDHGVFIGFAPFDNPEIAIALVVEQGKHGSACAQIAKDVFNEYFFGEGDTNTPQKSGRLLP